MLGAIVAGAARPPEIAATLGRPQGAVDDRLGALTAMGFIERLQDPLDRERSGCVVVKPIARLHRLVIAPNEAELAAGRADRVWARQPGNGGGEDLPAAFRVGGQAVVPAPRGRGNVGGVARAARPTAIACREHRQEHS